MFSYFSDLSKPCSTAFGIPCKFPFKYEGKEYFNCTSDWTGYPWCSTTVNENGENMDESLQACSLDCTDVSLELTG